MGWNLRLPYSIATSIAVAGMPVAVQSAQAYYEQAADADTVPDLSTASASRRPPENWRELAKLDLAAFADAVRQNHIYAAYPNPVPWLKKFERTLSQLEKELALVRDEGGYQAVLRHFAATFEDAHVSVRFTSPSTIQPMWPGFLGRLDNDTYRVTASRHTDVADGTEVSACDGKPLSWWIARIAQYEVGLPDTLEKTRNDAALRLFVDRGSPLRPRPSRCVIGGRAMALSWTQLSPTEIDPIIRSWRGARPPEVSTKLIGDGIAWVKLGFFEPGDAAQTIALHSAISAAASLRSKRYVVLDVRGNGGGPYNWFMAYLRGLYGQAYADHYATARLRIRPVFRLSPAYLTFDREDATTASAIEEPLDPPNQTNNVENEMLQKRAIAAGESVFLSKPNPKPSRSAGTPQNPVRADVFVLTDTACASACISFVDEVKRFPGVRQIGLPTGVDSRSGTAVEIGLPSENATVFIPAMTRDGRLRGDNEAQLPSIRFNGDIRSDQEVQSWFLQDVIGKN